METIEQLASAIQQQFTQLKTLADLRPVLAQYQGQDWQDKQKFSNEDYQRIPLWMNSQFEIRLLCWQAQQASKIHDHPQQGCILRVLKGYLTETLFSTSPLAEKCKTDLSPDMISYIDNHRGVHQITAGGDPAVSLHIYSPPNYQPHYYS